MAGDVQPERSAPQGSVRADKCCVEIKAGRKLQLESLQSSGLSLRAERVLRIQVPRRLVCI